MGDLEPDSAVLPSGLVQHGVFAGKARGACLMELNDALVAVLGQNKAADHTCTMLQCVIMTERTHSYPRSR